VPLDEPAWWRDAVIYQVYPRSFADGDGDGIGDLPGITARLPHLAELGVDAVWLSPFYPSPQADGGYDVSDYCDVDPVFGTLDDLGALVARAHDLGLRVIIDLVPNHTSDQHPWFRAALAAGPGSAERGRYLFRTGRGPAGDQPPNNWRSLFGGPAWTRVGSLTGGAEDADQWYLHLFDTRQPDLDWDNREVRAYFEDVLRFWLDRGVDGFRVDVAHGMVKEPGLPDWSGTGGMVMGDAMGDVMGDVTDPAHPDSSAPDPSGRVELGPMFDQPGVHDIYRAWNRVLASYPGQYALVAEACVEPLERVAHYVRPDEMQQAFNFAYMQCPWDAGALRGVIDESLRVNEAVGAPTTWVLSNHDVVRHASLLGLRDTGRSPYGIGVDDEQPDAALGLRRARAAALLTLALPGSAYLYQGEELGLPEHTTLDDDLRQDPTWERSGHTQRGRDGCRVPLAWTAGAPAFGFSPTGASWLPQPADWAELAADVQTGVPGSTLELYRAALRLRREHRLGSGALRWTDEVAAPPDGLAFANRDVQVVVNLGRRPLPLPPGARVLLASTELPGDLSGDAPPVLPGDCAAWLHPG
jgi:alpha-glucosidase